MRVVITGSSGLIGTALTTNLRADGHEVVRLVRREPRAADERRWDPARHDLDPGLLAGADAVVHLAGAGIGDHRWTDDYKREIRDSRVDGTTTVAEAVAKVDGPPPVLVSASGIDYYGDTGEEVVDESSPAGAGFLPEVVHAWEGATAAAAEAGARLVLLRSGLVLSPDGGLLARILPLFRLGVGGRLGSGRQWMSWIALPDHIAAVRFLLGRDDLAGAFDLTAPEPVRNSDFTKALGRAVRRPALALVPSFGLRAVFGELADGAALASHRVLPTRLEDAGFGFTYADIDAALGALLR